MTSPQDQYTAALRTSQDAVVQAMESWTKSARDAFGQMPSTPPSGLEPNQVIDQVFDFAERMLEVQREFSKSLAASAASAGETAREQAESAGETIRQQSQPARARKSTTTGSGPKSQPRARKK